MKKSVRQAAEAQPEMPAIMIGKAHIDPVFEEGNKLREEASRALTRLLVHEAQHSSWRVESVAKAISALRSY